MANLTYGVCLLLALGNIAQSANIARISSGRIIGGDNATIEEVPWHVSIQYYSMVHCGGAIINEDTIISASHCFDSHGTDPEAFSVRLATNKRAVGGELVKVKSITMHPEFNISTYNCDIAIVKLERKLNFTDQIQPIKMADANESLPIDQFGLASGFGLLSYEEPAFPTVLQKVNLKVLNQTVCETKYKEANHITKYMFCAGGDGKHDACGGDSGGPFVVNGKLQGVISYAIKCALPEFPGVFARISTLRDWIDRNI